jgi:DNA polymerase-1
VTDLGDPSRTLYLLDISSFIFRAYYATMGRTTMRTSAGEPTNAVFVVANMINKLKDEAKPEYLAVVYDSKEPSFRKEIYPEYKANRASLPEDLIPQFGRIEELVKALELRSMRQSGVEADDLIATATKLWCRSDASHRVVIVTSDKDLMQLVDDRVRIWDTMSGKIYGPPEVEEKFGVKPTQIRDYLALVGDSSDNIPGVAGIGPKTAADLLKQYGDLEGVLRAAQSGAIPGKRGETIRTSEKDARLSAELATIHEKLELDLHPENCRYKFHVTPACADLLRKVEFHTLLTRWAAEASLPAPSDSDAPPPGTVTDPDSVSTAVTATASDSVSATASASALPPDAFRTINTESAFNQLLEQLARRREFGFDLETTSLNPRLAELVGVAICHDRSHACYIPVGHRGTSVEQLPVGLVLDKLKPFLEDPRYKKIGQNLKYDWSVLLAQGLKADGIGADTMIAAYVLDPEGRHNLETLAQHHLGYAVTTYEQVCGKGPDQIGFDQVPIDQATRYSAEDALIAVRLWEKLRAKLEEERLMRIYAEVDLPLVNVLVRMEAQGVCIDTDWLRQLSTDFSKELRGIEERVAAFTQGPINLNSTQQLARLLFDELKLPPQSKTKSGYSTDARVLEALAPLHEVPRLLLEYREISKLKGTYVDPLPQLRDPKTGKIHAGFHQTVAATGRLSSSDPNLQNIPIRSERGRRIRRAFVPESGNVLVGADYSQIELRLLAHLSGDEDLVRSFRADEDVHRRTASEIFHVDAKSVDDRQRGIAKAINFGLMYGKTPFGLAQELKIPQKEAREIIDRYFQRYSGVKRYLDGLISGARERGFAETLLGRKRKLPDLASRNPAVRGNAERMAMNTPLQGTAADLMKLAMIELDQRLAREGFRARITIQVHDEVLLDTPRDEVAAVEKVVTEVMEGVHPLSVPLRVNAASGASWQDL